MIKQAQLNKLRWHARRGMWELDLLLVPFVENCFTQLSAEQQESLIVLLAEEDQDLYMWLLKRSHCPRERFQSIIAEIQNFASNPNSDQFRPI